MGALLRYGILLGIGMLLCSQAEARTIKTEDFPFSAPLDGRPSMGPVKIAVPSEILSRSAPGTANCRVFDDLGREVPFLIDIVREPERQSVRWEIVRSQETAEGASFIIGNPNGADFVNNLEVIADREPGCADIEVYSTVEGATWQLVAKGRVADLRPAYNAYRMGIVLRETVASQLKVILKRTAAQEEQEVMKCNPFGDDLPTLDALSGIRGFEVVPGKGSGIGPGLDDEVFEGPPCSLDDQGDTVIDLGRVGLPVEEVSIRVADGCFYRQMELDTTDRAGETLYRSRGIGAIYRVPWLALARDTVTADVPKAYSLRIKIVNGGASPLAVDQVRLKWARRYLVFIPQQERSYIVCYGSLQISGAQYGLDWKTRYGSISDFPVWKVGRSSPNADYEPERLAKEQFKRFFVIGVVILLAYFLGFWIIRIRDLLPRR